MEADADMIVDEHGKALTLQKVTRTPDTEYGGIIEEVVVETSITGYIEEISIIEKFLVYGQDAVSVIRGYFKKDDNVVVGDRIVDGSITYDVTNTIDYDAYTEAELKKFGG